MTDQTPRPPAAQTDDNPQLRFFGGCLMAVGGLIAVSCGLCTLFVGGVSVVSTLTSSGLSSLGGLLMLAVIALVVGGLPAGVGVMLFILGRRMFRRGRSPSRPE